MTVKACELGALRICERGFALDTSNFSLFSFSFSEQSLIKEKEETVRFRTKKHKAKRCVFIVTLIFRLVWPESDTEPLQFPKVLSLFSFSQFLFQRITAQLFRERRRIKSPSSLLFHGEPGISSVLNLSRLICISVFSNIWLMVN